MTTEIHQRVARIKAGTYAPALAKLSSGYVVMGDPQVLPGYCLLYPDPIVPHLNAMTSNAARQFLSDMHLVGDVVWKTLQSLRVNYEILGNLAPALHAHVIPRYESEHPDLRTKPIWSYDWTKTAPFDPAIHGDLFRMLQAALFERGATKL